MYFVVDVEQASDATPLQYLQTQVKKCFQIIYLQYNQINNKNAKGLILIIFKIHRDNSSKELRRL